MKESFVRDRTTDDGSAAGSVDKTVVNWLMHVISGKAPTELGLNDAREPEPEVSSPAVTARSVPKEKAAPPASSLNVTAEDLCGAPVVPIGPVAYEPIVYEVVTDEELAEEAALSSQVEAPVEVEPERAPEPERVPLSFKRPTGPQLVDTPKTLPPVTTQSLAVQLLRDEAQYEAPASERASSIADSLRRGAASSSSAPAPPIDPLDLTRDPDYYEEKMRARESVKDATGWVEPKPVTPVFEDEADLVEVVEHHAPAPVQSVPAGAEMSMQPELRQEPVAAATEVAETRPTVVDPFAGVDFSPTPEPEAVAVPAAPAIPDPFAGVEFGTSAPEPVVPEPVVAPEVAVVAPEVAAVEVAPEPEVAAVVPEPVVETAPETVQEPEVQAAPAVAAAPEVPAAPAIPDPFAGVDFSSAPAAAAEVVAPVEMAPAVPEAVAAEAEIAPEMVPEAAAPAVVEPEIAAAAPEAFAEPEIVAPEVAAEPEVVEPEVVAAAAEQAVAPAVEAATPEVQAVQEVAARPAIADPFAGIDFGTETTVQAETAEPVAVVAAPETEAAAPEAVEIAPEVVEPEIAPAEAEVAEVVPEPEAVLAAPETAEVVAEPVQEPVVEASAEPVVESEAAEPVAAEPEIVELVTEVAEPAAAEAEVKAAEPEAVPEAVPEAAAEVVQEAAPEAAEAAEVEEAVPETVPEAPRTWSWMMPEAPPAIPEIAAQATQAVKAAHDATPKTAVAKGIAQPEAGIPQTGKAAVDAGSVAPGDAKPEDLSAAIKTLMQLGSVLPLASRMAPREGEVVQEPVAADGQEVKQEVSGLRLLQYEIKTTVQDQSMHLKRLEEQLARMRESAEMDSAESASAMDNMKSTAKMVRVMGIGLGAMLLVLILLIGMVLMHVK